MLDEALKVLLTKRLVPPARKESSLVAEPSAPLGTFSSSGTAWVGLRWVQGDARPTSGKRVTAGDPDTNPFHRKHFVQAAWALVILAVGGVTGVVWQRYQGPTAVVVLNQDTTTRVIVRSDSAQQALLRQMISEMTALRLATRPRATVPVPLKGDTATAPLALAPNPLQIPPFVLPASAKGYLLSDLGAFARASCPTRAHRAGADIAAALRLRSARDTARLSPIHVYITRRSSPTGGIQLFSQQYQLLPRSLVVFPAPSTPGRYDLEFGVFLRAPTSEEYPPFYRRECTIEVS
jgi:hypothetical protein